MDNQIKLQVIYNQKTICLTLIQPTCWSCSLVIDLMTAKGVRSESEQRAFAVLVYLQVKMNGCDMPLHFSGAQS